jgi:hypothetical protein
MSKKEKQAIKKYLIMKAWSLSAREIKRATARQYFKK